ncbi:MAG TPA: hypothetical protein VLA47_04040 [Nitrospira sp.]|nr:hypothetical protein [Nitrospira sp.]
MTNCTLNVGLTVAVSLAMTGFLFAGEPAGIGEKGTGQTKKSTERQQSGNQPDMSQVPQELRQGKSAQAAEELKAGEQRTPSGGLEPAGIGEKGTGQTKKSTERQQSQNKPDMSQVPEELQQGKSARAAEELSHEKKN